MARARKGPASHRLDVYDVVLHLATSRKQWRAMRRTITDLEKRTPSALGQVQFLQWESNAGRVTNHYVVWLNVAAVRDHRDLVDTIAHEAFHAARGIHESCGVEEKGNAEACAYLTGWIAGWIWENVTPPAHFGNEKAAS